MKTVNNVFDYMCSREVIREAIYNGAFEVALNMIKSDYCPLLKRWFPDESKEDHIRRLVALTVNWLSDEDNPFGTEKVWLYFNH